ncbi:MAG: 50S ribosomal protein L11 methyltransferase [Acidobacteria bacterium]|nr:50S ribosomal protein L11 methyltransferase [Acidobacteriota bacterium]
MSPERSRKIWWLVRLTVEPEVEEPVSTVLWNAGTVGLSSSPAADKLVLTAYFTGRPNLSQLQSSIEAFLTSLQIPHTALTGIEEEQLIEEDWLQKWKEGYHPIVVGERFVIAPSWEKPADPSPRFVIKIDPGMAFGTGTHATTQLCLIAIEQSWRGGRFLDVGTGTGILAIAAAKLHPDATVVAVDNDPIAVEVARENLIGNDLAGKVELLIGSIDSLQGTRFDLIVANLTAEIIEALSAEMMELLADDGVLILSGLLAEQEEAMRNKLDQVGFRVVNRLASGQWLALVSESGEAKPTAVINVDP